MEFINQRNPLLPLKHHIPDGEAHVMPDGKLYVYGSYDALDTAYCSEKYHVVSTPDLKHWTVHGISFQAGDVPWAGDPEAARSPGIGWYHPTSFLQKMIDSMPEEEKAAAQGCSGTGDGKELLFASDCIYRDEKYSLYFCMSDNSEGVVVSDRPEGPFKDPFSSHVAGSIRLFL